MLNKQQLAVVEAPMDTNICVIACAGSGKTTTVLKRIVRMIVTESIDPSEILLTTFTVEATHDMTSRLNSLVGSELVSQMQIGTIDSISRATLQKFAFDWIAKYHIMSVSEFGPLFLRFLQTHPKRQKYMDKVKYLIVDEYQDINQTQYQIFQELYKNGLHSIVAIGDDSQNIYSFRGSDVSYILNFNQQFNPTLSFKLTKNYRCTAPIVELANASIKRNLNQIPKHMIAHNTGSFKPRVMCYRTTNEQSIKVIKLIKDITAVTSVSLNDVVVLCRMVKPLYAIETLLEKKQIPYILLDSRYKKPKHTSPSVTLCTVHKSKGLEWKHVILLECSDSVFPMVKETDSDIEEERRLFYVAVTRAKERLYCTFNHSSYKVPMSRFLTEISPSLYLCSDSKASKIKAKSNSQEFGTNLGVCALIKRLDGDDFLKLRDLHILPNLKFEKIQLDKKIKIPKWVRQKRLHTNFGSFVDLFYYRELCIHHKHPFQVLPAKRLLARVELIPQHYAVYQDCIYPIRFNEDMMIKLLNDPDNNNLIVKNLLKRIFEKASQHKIHHTQVPIFVTNYIPYKFHIMISGCLQRFENQTNESRTISHDIFWLSQCSEIIKYRKRILSIPIEINEIQSIGEQLQQSFQKYLNFILSTKNADSRNNLTKIHQYLKSPFGINGEIDVIHGDFLIDWKTSIKNELSLEWVMQLLMYTYLCRENNIPVNKIGIFNTVKNCLYHCEIDWWKKNKTLASYLTKHKKMKNI